MKRTNTLLMISLFTSAAFAQLPQRTVNFSPAISGATNYTKIEAALSGTSPNTIIWVAAGTYLENELIIPSGVTLIGGFPANASTATDRVYPGVATANQQTILDGNYTHRVATVRGILDGVIITKGYANLNETNGGGVLIDGGTVQNCIITKNIASPKTPSPENIPGTYVASIGDIYCTDGTILKPIYTVNSSGVMVANLSGGIPSGKIVQGIIFYIDPAATSGRIYIMGEVSKTDKDNIWTNPTFDIFTIDNITELTAANSDFNGRTKTDAIISYISDLPAQLTNKKKPQTVNYAKKPPTVNYAAVKYAYEYNTPSNTQGEWYLPAAGELQKLWDVHKQMDACARIIPSWGLTEGSMFPAKVFWSSSEQSEKDVWVLNNYTTNNPILSKVSKTQGGYTIPITSKTLAAQ